MSQWESVTTVHCIPLLTQLLTFDRCPEITQIISFFIFAITLQGSDSGCFPLYFTDEEKTFLANLKKTAKKDNIKHKENSADI